MRSMKHIIAAFALLFGLNSVAALIDESNVSQYKVNIKKMELWNNTTSTWHTLSETNTGYVDIAAVDAGAQVASMIDAGVILTYGTYTKARATVDDEFKVKACGTSGANCMNGSWASGTVAAATTSGLSTPTEMTYLIDFSSDVPSSEMTSNNATAISGGVQMEYTFATPFVMDASTATMDIDVAFDVDNIFNFDTSNNYITINFPKVTITIQ